MPDKGVLSYAHGQAVVDVYFPNGEAVCKWCPLFLRYEENFKRYSCRLTCEWIPDPFRVRGERCPLTMQTGEEDTHGDPHFGAR